MDKRWLYASFLVLPCVIVAFLISFLISVWAGVASLLPVILFVLAASKLEDNFLACIVGVVLASAIVAVIGVFTRNGFWNPPDWKAGILGAAIGVLFVLAAFSMALWMSVDPILTLSAQLGKAHWTDVMHYMLTFLFQKRQPWVVIDDGDVISEKPAGILKRFGGPGILVINPGNAVVTTRRGMVKQVWGNGIHETERLEKIKKVVDLSPQWEIITADDVLTMDGIPLKVNIGVGFQIRPCNGGDRQKLPDCGDNVSKHADDITASIGREIPLWDCCIPGSFSVRLSDILRAVFNPSSDDWHKAPFLVLSQFRDIVAELDLSALLGMNVLQELANRTSGMAGRIFPGWGLRLNGVRINSISPPDNLKRSWFEHWGRMRGAEDERTAMEHRGKGTARQIDIVEKAKLEAFDNLQRKVIQAIYGIKNLGTLDRTGMEILEFMNTLSERLGAGDVVAYRYLHILENIAKSEGDKTFFIGGEDRELLEAMFRKRGDKD